MNVYLHELRSHWKSTAIWIVSVSAATAVFMAVFTVFRDASGDMARVFEGFPKEVLNAFGIPEIGKLFTLPGFYSFVLGFLVVCGAVQAMNLGISSLGREAAGKTSDFLLTKPVTRARVITFKLLAALALLAVSSAVFLFSATVCAFAVSAEAFDYGVFALMSLSFFWVQLIFAAMGFAMSVLIARIKSVLPVSLSTVFGFYIIGSVSAALGEKTLEYFTPFKYFDPVYILQHSAYDWKYAAIGAAAITISVAAGYLVYGRKDIRAA